LWLIAVTIADLVGEQNSARTTIASHALS
jgi:hypothetical protein